VGKLGLQCPVYATTPIFKMGQMFMYDTYLNHYNSEDFSLFNLDDVDAAFDRIKQLEYHHTVSFKGVQTNFDFVYDLTNSCKISRTYAPFCPNY